MAGCQQGGKLHAWHPSPLALDLMSCLFAVLPSVLLSASVSPTHHEEQVGPPTTIEPRHLFFLMPSSLLSPGAPEQPQVLLITTAAPHQQETGPVPAPSPAQWGAPQGSGDL